MKAEQNNMPVIPSIHILAKGVKEQLVCVPRTLAPRGMQI